MISRSTISLQIYVGDVIIKKNKTSEKSEQKETTNRFLVLVSTADMR